MKNLAAIRTIIRQKLRDEIAESVTPDFEDNEIDLHIAECLVEISRRRGRKVREILFATYKTGTATATTASHLVDTTNLQFESGDVGKTVYNSTDNTTAKITVYTSTSDVTLDTNIMASGETYYIFDTDCSSAKELSITSLREDDKLIEVEKAEWPTRQSTPEFRNVTVFGDILKLEVDTDPEDNDEVFLYCSEVHSLTDSASTLTAALEDLLIKGVVAKLAQSWCAEQLRKDVVPTAVGGHKAWADGQWVSYMRELESLAEPRAWKYYPRG